MTADNVNAIGDSVECCNDDSKPHQCPEEIWEDAKLMIPENGENNNNVCELFYDTTSGDDWDKENDENIMEPPQVRDTSHDHVANGVDPGFYINKNVMTCDLPETVKDICVDEGVPVQKKFLFGEKDSVNSDKCSSKDLKKADKTNVNQLDTKFSEDSNIKVDDSEICNDHKIVQDVEESSREDFADAEGSSSRLEEQSLSQLQDNEKRSLETIALETEELNKAEEKISSVSTTTSQEPNKTCKHLETENHQTHCLLENSYKDDKFSSSRLGEGSFCAEESVSVSVSGHITYTGPIVYSGSLSVRSDASTTSERSFTFPILQSEWNSSPVRMAKADKRRQKGGWRHILLCCIAPS